MQESRDYVTKLRLSKGLPAWDWERMCSSDRPVEETPMPEEHKFPARLCACGCGESFHPARPGVAYKHGHKPKPAGYVTPVKRFDKPAAEPRLVEDPVKQRVVMVGWLRAQLTVTAANIDETDNRLEAARLQVQHHQTFKDHLVQQHEKLSVALTELEGVDAQV